jgi:hypothetical protein
MRDERMATAIPLDIHPSSTSLTSHSQLKNPPTQMLTVLRREPRAQFHPIVVNPRIPKS